MNFKKFLGIISVLIFVVFAMMFGTSYAWYSYKEASTEFDVTTSNDEILVTFQRGEYIDTNIAIPITDNEIDKYSEKSNFTVRMANNDKDSSMLISVSLVDIDIDSALQDSHFKVALYHQGKLVGDVIDGLSIGAAEDDKKVLGSVTLDNDVDNNFELRVYIHDDGNYGTNEIDLNRMMNQTFQARIQVDVVSKVNFKANDFSNSDILVSDITIDGTNVNYVPNSGFYMMEATCDKGSDLSWEPYSKTIIYESGTKTNDTCSLVFTSAISDKLLNTVKPGSYVKYVGNNGCVGKACEGQNANYVSDKRMGYCDSESYQFITNGWRVAYIKGGTAYLVSAGAPECIQTYVSTMGLSGNSTPVLSTDYYYGTGYTFNENTGVYTLTGVTDSVLDWASNYESIISNTPYTCQRTEATATCSTIYEVINFKSKTTAIATAYYNYDGYATPNHVAHLDKVASTYCNKKFAYKGVCDSNSVWAMNIADFENITGSSLSASSCYNSPSYVSCGFNNDLIDNGSHYWFANYYNESDYYSFSWDSARYVSKAYSNVSNGVRPVLRLDSDVLVSSGSGTYKDPYILKVN